MYSTDAALSPAERRRDIAAILAAGILRLSIRSETMPEHAGPGAQGGTENLSDSGQKPLASGRGTSPYVLAG